MKRLNLFVISMLLGLPAMASNVIFSFTNSATGLPDTNYFLVYPVSGPNANADGSFTTKGLPTKVTPKADGRSTNYFGINNWLATNAFLGKGVAFRVTDSGTAQKTLGELAISGYNQFVTISYGTNPPPTLDEITNAVGGAVATTVVATNAAVTVAALATNNFTTLAQTNPAAVVYTNLLPALTNGLLPTAATNTLADTNFVIGATNVLWQRVVLATNGLASVTQLTAATNGLVGASVTNGLSTTNFVLTQVSVSSNALYIAINTTGGASTNYVTAATNGLVTASVTNGLATTNFVNAQIASISAVSTNGLAGTNYVNTATNDAVALSAATTLASSNVVRSAGIASNTVVSAYALAQTLAASNTLAAQNLSTSNVLAAATAARASTNGGMIWSNALTRPTIFYPVMPNGATVIGGLDASLGGIIGSLSGTATNALNAQKLAGYEANAVMSHVDFSRIVGYTSQYDVGIFKTNSAGSGASFTNGNFAFTNSSGNSWWFVQLDPLAVLGTNDSMIGDYYSPVPPGFGLYILSRFYNVADTITGTISGTNINAGTVNSNAFDAATLALIPTTNTFATTNFVIAATNDLASKTLATAVSNGAVAFAITTTNTLGTAARSNATAFQPSSVTLTNLANTGAITNLAPGTGIAFTTNAPGSLTVAATGTAAGAISILNGAGTNTYITNATLAKPIVDSFIASTVLFNNATTSDTNSTDSSGFQVVIGGQRNKTTGGGNGILRTIVGGSGNTIHVSPGVEAYSGSIWGGQGCNITNSGRSAIFGGLYNSIEWGKLVSASCPYASSVIVGGEYNRITNSWASFAAGKGSYISHDGVFMFSDTSSGDYFTSAANNEFAVRASGGVRLVTSNSTLTVNGEYVLTNGGAYSFTGNGAGLTNIDAGAVVKYFSQTKPAQANSNWFGPWTPGTTTAGIQEAWDSVTKPANAGPVAYGVKFVFAPGYFYFTNALVFSNYYPMALTFEGVNLLTTKLVYSGSGEGVDAIRFRGPDTARPSSLNLPNHITIQDMGFSAITDTTNILLRVDNYSHLNITRCNFTSWLVMTNQVEGAGVSTDNASVSGVPSANLVGLFVNGGQDHSTVLNDIFFAGLATGLYTTADHVTSFGLKFAHIGNLPTNCWPKTTNFHLGACIVREGGLDSAWYYNHFYSANAGFVMLANGYDVPLLDHANFESCSHPVSALQGGVAPILRDPVVYGSSTGVLWPFCETVTNTAAGIGIDNYTLHTNAVAYGVDADLAIAGISGSSGEGPWKLRIGTTTKFAFDTLGASMSANRWEITDPITANIIQMQPDTQFIISNPGFDAYVQATPAGTLEATHTITASGEGFIGKAGGLIFTNAVGTKFRLVVNATTNGFNFVHVP